ncbi:MAG: hypothetical protein COX77_01390 [Candidatus Komeilibacteria bacterium CG_4_10_14_0_2_um_filter_37_10]|uniref:Uncharacterized protein n=1 Tax=Candidatus Komeilibacteria bacterium CG_4_10_14_0_2_um_filter_37_10 TaxID=1974470 RepID=A0A2M7VFS2_9BACT|nr:MAG: hypothetical protein COX77_01390 [Candidatus Komeilibacteria bacterium CG_4_10_14_0_2_um_filter_37_10]
MMVTNGVCPPKAGPPLAEASALGYGHIKPLSLLPAQPKAGRGEVSRACEKISCVFPTPSNGEGSGHQ